MSFARSAAAASHALRETAPWSLRGHVVGVSGLEIEVAGLSFQTSIGDRLRLHTAAGAELGAEIVGFRNNIAQAMALGPIEGLGPGAVALGPAAPQDELFAAPGWHHHRRGSGAFWIRSVVRSTAGRPQAAATAAIR